jgi:hypothetical protein
MNKYNTEEYFSVIDKKTGRKIVDCAEWSDAMMMFGFDPHNRQIIRNKFLMGQVIDIEMPKALPTTNIAVSDTKENIRHLERLGQIKLPQGQQEPFVV